MAQSPCPPELYYQIKSKKFEASRSRTAPYPYDFFLPQRYQGTAFCAEQGGRHDSRGQARVPVYRRLISAYNGRMGFFSEDAGKVRQQQEAFFREFEEKAHDKPCSLELAECRADETARADMGFSGGGALWGLIVFCERDVYFYSAAQDSYMSFFAQGAGRQEEQLVRLGALKQLQFCRAKKRRPAFLFPENERTIEARFTGSGGLPRSFTLVLGRRADEVLDKLRKSCASS